MSSAGRKGCARCSWMRERLEATEDVIRQLIRKQHSPDGDATPPSALLPGADTSERSCSRESQQQPSLSLQRRLLLQVAALRKRADAASDVSAHAHAASGARRREVMQVNSSLEERLHSAHHHLRVLRDRCVGQSEAVEALGAALEEERQRSMILQQREHAISFLFPLSCSQLISL
jgi:hypothetical protein